MQGLRKAKAWLLCALATVLIACGSVGGVLLHRELRLDSIQKEALHTLEEEVGTYDEQTLVLNNTTKARAEELAEKFGAELRITANGEFASLTLPEGQTVYDVYEERNNRTLLSELSLDYKMTLSETDEGETPTREHLPTIPDYEVTDPDYNRQPSLNYINLQDTWAKTKGKNSSGEKVTVAIIDSGIDYDHPEFIDADGNTIISEWSYYATEDKIVKDYVLEDGSYNWELIQDQNNEVHGAYHGTRVAGVIAAQMNNGIGITGIAPEVELLVIKCKMNDDGTLNTSDCVFGLYYAIERDADIVSMSIGGAEEDPWLAPVQLAYESDIICVASAGNDNSSTPQYPAACEKVIGVGALAENSWEKAEYSNYGDWVDVFAPEVNWSTTNGGYDSFSGTSSSAPVVSAALALYKTQNKYVEFDTLYETLIASTVDLGDLGPDFYYGWGALDINALIWEEKGTVTFDYLTDEIDETKQIFVRGHALQNIPEPERLYAAFDGWYYDIHCENEINYYEDIWTDDLTLYAKWINEDEGTAWIYTTLSDGTIELNSYTGKRRFITAPSQIEGKTVSSIGSNCFAYNSRLRQVTLPDTIKYIKASAFNGCYNLLNITIPESVISIGESAFYQCSRLSSVGIPTNGALTSIGTNAFAGCGRLSRMDLPVNLQSVDGTAFYGATAMRTITVAEGNKYFTVSNGALYTKDKSTILYLPAALTGMFEIDSATKTVGEQAFAYSKKTQISIPNGVTALGDEAFAYSALTTVAIPNSVGNIAAMTFYYCRNLQNVTFEDNGKLTNLGQSAFDGCSSLHSVDFGQNSSLTQIDAYAFEYCYSLKAITIPKGVETISSCAFYSAGLQSVTFESQNTLTQIQNVAFAYCRSLINITLPTSVTYIGDRAFQNSGLQQFTVGQQVTRLGDGVFAYCGNLTSLDVEEGNTVYTSVENVIYYNNTDGRKVLYCRAGGIDTDFVVPEDVYIIDTYAFAGCGMQHVTLNEGLNEIKNSAFSQCRELLTIGFPQSLETIGVQAFEYCTSLGDIVITKNIINLARFAFYYDYNIKHITIEEGSKLSRLGYGVFGYTGITSFTVPSSISSIAQYAFEGCRDLKTVTFAEGNSLESISAYMFDGATALERINFAQDNTIKHIQARAFSGMSSLKYINWEALTNLEEIDNYAFWGCSSLQNVTLPQGVMYIGRYAFTNCKSFTRIDIPESVEYIGRYAFSGDEQLNVYFKSSVLPEYVQDDWDYGIRGYYVGVAEVVESGEWSYAVLSDGTVSLVKYNGNATTLDISTIDGKTVSAIGGYAFNGNTTLQSVTLPNTINAIYNYAFANTAALQSVVIPEGVKTIHDYAFYKSGISTVSLPNGLKKIGKYAFAETKNLTGVTIPNTVETIGDYAFQNSNLSSLDFAENSTLTEIGESAFSGSKVRAVAIPDSVTRIHDGAFYNTTLLTSLTLGNGNLRIDANAFYNSGITGELYIPANTYYLGEFCFGLCTNLTAINVSEENTYYTSVDGVLYKKDLTRLITCPAGKTGSFTIDNSIQTIAFGAFEGSKLSEIVITDDSNLMTIGYRAFFGMKNLKSITIPDSVLSIDYYAFAYCENLEEVIISENSQIGGIYEGAFYNCASLQSFYIPKGVQEISDYAFYGCSALTEFTFHPECELKGIYKYALAYTGMTELVLPETLLEIGEYAFAHANITELVLPESLLEIGEYAFADMPNVKEIRIPAGVVEIGFAALKSCNRIESLTIPVMYNCLGFYFGTMEYGHNEQFVPQNLTSVVIFGGNEIPDYAFYRCSSLTSIVIPESVTSIGGGAFSECSRLTSIVIPEGVTSIGDSAFRDCLSLTSIVIPEGVTSIGNYAFDGCSSLTSIEVSENNPNYFTQDGIIYDRINKTICAVPEKAYGEIVLWEQLTSIGNYAFSGCSSLTSIIIPEGVTSIGYHAFSGCSSLTSIAIPESVTSIGEGAFSGCISLTSIVIPEGVTSISNSVFCGCSSLTSIVIPEGVTSIGDSAFRDCLSLTSIVIPEGVTSIDWGAFYNCSRLTSIDLPGNVTSIGDSAFDGCRSLTGIVIPESVTSIGNSAFSWCSSLTGIVIPESVTSIGNNAFYDCSLTIGFKADELPASLGENWNGGREYYLGVKEFATNEQFTYLIDKEDNAVILKYVGTETEVVIDEINGCPVMSISNYAFARCYSLTSIVIPESVTSIGNNAFDDCYSLTSIEIPKGVTSIGNSAFSGCSRLTIGFKAEELPASLGDNWNGGREYYLGVKELATNEQFSYLIDKDDHAVILKYVGTATEVIIDKINGCSVTSIGNSAFYGCRSLTSIEIPEGVTSIGDDAFYLCSSLTSIVIPDSVTSIGSWAFYGCWKLKSIDIPESVTSIGNDAFRACSGLTSIVIPDGVTSIGDSVFYGCSSLTSIVLPEGVTSIGSSAFYGCRSLTNIVIPESVTSIGGYVFDECYRLTIGFKAEELPASLGDNWNGGREYYLGVKELATNEQFSYLIDKDDHAVILKYVGTATEVIIDKINGCSVTSIGSSAFDGCSSLTSIVIPEGVTSIGSSAFSWCSSLTSIVIPEGVTSIGNYAFYYCSSLTSIVIPEGVTNIGSSAFCNCSGLTSIVIPDGVTSIGDWAFSGCRSLTSIVIPDSVTSIGYRAFSECSSLTNIKILGYTYIDSQAFYNVNGEITFVKYKQAALGWSSGWNNGFHGKVVYLAEETYQPSYTEGLSFSLKNGTYAVSGYNGSETSVIVPDVYQGVFVTRIGDYAFEGCSGLTSIIISEGVTSIGTSAFYRCSSLTSIEIPESVTSIGYGAFSECSSLTSIVIPEGVTSIDWWAFSGCSSLTSIEIPESVTSIGDGAFYLCSSLTSIVIPESVTSIGYRAFSECSSLTNVTVGENSQLTSIGHYAFYRCSSLTSIVIPESVTSIGEWAFKGCSSLTSIVIPKGVTSIGDATFARCSSLTSIVIPEGVMSIGDDAFGGCSSLTSIEIPESVTSIGNSAFAECWRLTIGFKAEKLPVRLADNWNGACEYLLGIQGSGVKYNTVYLIDSSNNAIILGIKDKNVEYIYIPDEIDGCPVTEIKENSYSNCPSLKYLRLPVLPETSYRYSFPSTLQQLILGPNVQDVTKQFDGAYNIYCYQDKETCTWQDNWYSNCTPYYLNEWYEGVFFDYKGDVLTFAAYSIGEVLKAPASTQTEVNVEHYDYKFTGWDINGDGIVDTLPATLQAHLKAQALYEVTCKHDLVEWIIDKAPTCTESGSKHKECTICHETLATEEIPAFGHTPANAVEENRVERTCTEDGRYDSVVYCSVCGEELSREMVTLSALGHDLVHHDAKAPTCTEIGWEAYDTCSRCDYTTYEALSALGHGTAAAVEENRIEASCTVDGHCDSVVYCSVCGEELSRETVTLSALGHDLVHHDAKAPTCTEIGWEAYDTCSRCDYTTYEEISVLGHDLVHHDAKAPTCTEIGWEAYDTCSRCGYTTYEEIFVLGHDLVHHEAKAPTCTEIGWETYDTCSRCDYSTYVELSARGHTANDWIVDKNATCTEAGSKYKECTVCHETLATEEIPALGHTSANAVEENRVDAICKADGYYDSVVYCSVCGEELSRERVTVSALGHSESDWIIDKNATCTEVGSKHKECTVCHEILATEEIPVLGHDYDYTNITWNWASDYSKATAMVVCLHDKSHTQEYTAVITSQTKDATATEDGEIVYTATVTVEEKTYKTEKRVTIPAQGQPDSSANTLFGCLSTINSNAMTVGWTLMALIVVYVIGRKRKES